MDNVFILNWMQCNNADSFTEKISSPSRRMSKRTKLSRERIRTNYLDNCKKFSKKFNLDKGTKICT